MTKENKDKKSLDAVDYLTTQHRVLENMLEQGMAEENLTRKKDLFAQVGDQLTIHIKSEEEIFYPAVKEAWTEDILLESLEEHLSLKRLLADLLELDPSEKTFEPKFKVLKEQAEHHHQEEEENLFPKVCKLLDEDARAELGEKMAELQQRLTQAGDPREAVTHETEYAAALN